MTTFVEVSQPEFEDDFELRAEALTDLTRRLSESTQDLRDALARFVPDADPYQLDVINAAETTIRLVAPAGSGKTQTAVQRVLHRIKGGVRPDRVLVLTFDNAAAASFREALQAHASALGVDSLGVAVSTLNAFGYRFIREKLPGEPTALVEAGRARRVISGLRDELKAGSPEKAALLPSHLRDGFYLDCISVLKNEVLDPRSASAQAMADFIVQAPQFEEFFVGAPDDARRRGVVQALLWLYRRYEKTLTTQGALDFDDQKLRPYCAMRDDDGLRDSVAQAWTEVIVDEFQDVNRLDFELIRTIASQATLVVCGDDDQAIYGFRGCSSDYIIDLEQSLGRPVRTYELRTNYRCPPNIVEHARRLIECNSRRIPKHPIAARRDNAAITVVSAISAAIEARLVADTARRMKESGLQYSDCVALYRTNAQSLPLQVELILNDIPYNVRKEDNILRNEELEKLLGALRVYLAHRQGIEASAEDNLLLIRSYFRYVNGRQQAALRAVLAERAPLVDLVHRSSFFTALPKARDSNLAQALAALLDAHSLMDALEVLARRFPGMQTMIGSIEESVEERVPLGEIHEIAAVFKGDAQAFVDTIEQARQRGRMTNAGEAEDGVSLRTFFRAKGLQWHTVILLSCNEGLVPHSRSPIEDERRLFYVAMTRPTANLIVSYVKNVCGKAVRPSRFLSEAGLRT